MIMEVYFESCLIHLLHFYPMIFASVICFERFVRTLIILIVIIIFLCSLGSANVHVLLLQAFHFFVFRSFLATRVKQRVVKASVHVACCDVVKQGFHKDKDISLGHICLRRMSFSTDE